MWYDIDSIPLACRIRFDARCMIRQIFLLTAPSTHASRHAHRGPCPRGRIYVDQGLLRKVRVTHLVGDFCYEPMRGSVASFGPIFRIIIIL